MKKVNLGNGLTLTAEMDKVTGILTTCLVDKTNNIKLQSWRNIITTCEICGKRFVLNDDTHICMPCREKMKDFFYANYSNVKAEERPKRRYTQKKKVEFYGKAVFADNNIVIDNLTECHNLTDGSISISRLETWLKFAIMGYSYNETAKKLNITPLSVKNGYRQLARLGLINLGGVRPSVTKAVIFHIDNETKQQVQDVKKEEKKENAFYGRVAPNKVTTKTKIAVSKIGPFLSDWADAGTIAAAANIQRNTTVSYLYELNRCGLIEKKRKNKTIYYKAKTQK